ncbi:epoxyqueuosine reductase QueH [Kosmotoga pacifica]|uniref:Epoxyqueuosine reductase QueH n=1 Tax=Kosmotoga pacifica TaxID=1330330 RepID=A0A0G2ZAA2_9BACT|nr:epoxyqueuosine reductase QueH [Kosmotoga pacifica]AKI96504.1 hypothetical protein IX53_00170 [Kosmotoga pacifica]
MILLHVCCAPDELIALEHLEEEDIKEITVFFFNPNIFPYEEYTKRLREFYKISKRYPIDTIEGEYDGDFSSNFLSKFATEPEGGKRCYYCIRYRLAVTAQRAKALGYSAFSTTLLASPKKNVEMVHRVGREVEKALGVKYIPFDFRNGKNKERIRELMKDVYKQNYCGCVFALREQVIKKQERDERDRMLFREHFSQLEHLWQFRGKPLSFSELGEKDMSELKKIIEILKPSALVIDENTAEKFGLNKNWLKCGKYNCRIERR